MNDSPEPGIIDSENTRFNQNLLIWPWIIFVSLLSLYTTSNGLRTILSDGGIQFIIISWAMSALLVVIAGFCSYQLGQAIANWLLGVSGDSRFGSRLLIPFIIMFALTATVSGLFSYTFWHEQFYKLAAKTMDARELPKALSNQVMPGLNKLISTQLDADAKSVKDSADVKTWADDSLNKLLKAASSEGASFAKMVEERIEKARETAAGVEKNRQKQIDGLNGEIKSITSQIAELDGQLSNVQKALQDPAAEPALVAATQTRDSEKEIADASERGADSSKIPGCGKLCQPHRDKQSLAEQEIARLTKALKLQIDKRDLLTRTIDTRKAELGDKNARLKDLTAQGGAGDLIEIKSASLADFQRAIAAFEHDPRDETLKAVSASCTSVKEIAVAVAPDSPDIATIDCQFEGGEGLRLIATRQAHFDAYNRWSATCDMRGDKSDSLGARINQISLKGKSDHVDGSSLLDDARELIEHCVEQSDEIGVDADDRETIQSKISDYVRDNSPNRDEFQRSITDLAKRTWPARFALLMSGFVELSILLFKMLIDIIAARLRAMPPRKSIGDPSDDPSESFEVRVHKAVYRNRKYRGGDADEIRESDIDGEDVPPELRQSVRALIADIAYRGGAKRKGESYWIRHDAIDEFIIPVLARAAGDANNRAPSIVEQGQRPSTKQDKDKEQQLRRRPPTTENQNKEEEEPASVREPNPPVEPPSGPKTLGDRLLGR